MKGKAAMAKQIVVRVDEKMSNAARIIRVIGTINQKGHSTERQPHRQSRLLRVPDKIVTVPVEKLRAVAAHAPQGKPPAVSGRNGTATHGTSPVRSAGNHRLKVEEWLRDRARGFRVKPEPDRLGRTVYVLAECPFDGSHGDPDSCVMQGTDGK